MNEHQGIKKGGSINFYEREGYMLSNFSAHAVDFEVCGKKYAFMTAEHAYQASKFTDTDNVVRVRDARSPREAKAVAHSMLTYYRTDWSDEIKLKVMEEILYAKLNQHQEVREFLLASGNKELVENSLKDSFWGTGRDEMGKSHLGKLWMQVREKIAKSD